MIEHALDGRRPGAGEIQTKTIHPRIDLPCPDDGVSRGFATRFAARHGRRLDRHLPDPAIPFGLPDLWRFGTLDLGHWPELSRSQIVVERRPTPLREHRFHGVAHTGKAPARRTC